MGRFTGTSKFFFYCCIAIAISGLLQLFRGDWKVAIFMFFIAAGEFGVAWWVSGPKKVIG